MTIDDLLSLPKEVQGELVNILTALHSTRYTGPITLHFHQGIPKTVQVPSPQIRLVDRPLNGSRAVSA